MPDRNSPSDRIVEQLQEEIRSLETRLEEVHLYTHVLLEIARALNASLDTRVIASNIISAISALVAVEKASVCLCVDLGKSIEVIGLFDSATPYPKFPPNYDFSSIRKIVGEEKTVYYPQHDEGPWGLVCCLPLLSAQRKIGCINIHSIRQPEITQSQMEFLETLAGYAASALHNALLYALVQRDSITDGLTEVYNYRYFQRRLREQISLCQRRQPHSSLGLLILDVDNFKNFNDRYGHQFGDTVLKTVVKVLATHLREEDILARYGGEEFVLLVPEATDETISTVSEKVRNLIQFTRIVNPDTEEEVSITVSIGATLWRLEDTVTSLIARADNALYRAKNTGRNQSALE